MKKRIKNNLNRIIPIPDSMKKHTYSMKNITSGAAAFAVTIEPRGGSENPSLETMQVVGNVWVVICPLLIGN